jgi:hypothetical protein
VNGPPSTPASTFDAFKRLPLVGRVLLAGLALLVAFEMAASLVAPLGGGDGGRERSQSSAYSTAARGLAGYAELLAESGHDVTRARQGLGDLLSSLPDQATAIVAGSVLTNDEADGAKVFLDRGGRVLLAGQQSGPALRRILDGPVRWTPESIGPVSPLVPVAETAGVRDVVAHGQGSWPETGPALPVLGEGGQALAAVADVGAGRLVLLADPTPLENANLATADNAAFGLAAAGPADRPIAFAEAAHVGGTAQGWRAVPSRWKWAIVAGALATALAMWSAGRRFGPPQDDHRTLPPPRRAYVDAVAATLARTKQPDASLAPLREAARQRLLQRAGLGPQADKEQVRRAAADLGLPPDEIDALFGAVTGDDKAMAVGRAMARLGGSRW